MLKAVIDIGSNSTLLFIGELIDGVLSQRLNYSTVTGLGRGLDETGMFSQEAMDDTYKALKMYSIYIQEKNLPLDEVIVTATEAARVAKNSKDFFEKIKTEIGFSIQIITGEGEAHFSALGASLIAEKSEEMTLIDIGGASTEIIRVSNNPFELIDFVSLPVGVVRLNDWKAKGTMEENLQNLQSDSLNRFKTSSLVGIAGSITSQATMILGEKHYSDELIKGNIIPFAKFSELGRSIAYWSPEKILKEFPFLGKRSLVTKSGNDLIKFFMERLGANEIIVSTYGLRHGVCYTVLTDGNIPEKFLS